MNGPDVRPAIHIAEEMENGAIETTDQVAFGYYETVPNVGDLLIAPPPWADAPEAVAVVRRAFILASGESSGRWWVVTRAVVDDSDWRPLWDLDRDVEQMFAEEAAERGADFSKKMYDEHLEKKRIQREEAAVRKALRPKGHLPSAKKAK